MAAVTPGEPGRVLSPYQDPPSLWRVKLGLVDPGPPSLLMEIGNALEPVVIAHARREGLLPQGTECGPPVSAPALRRDYLGAHPDLIGPDGPIDVKVVSRTTAAWDGAIPQHYVAQLAAQLRCLGATHGRAAILSCHLDHGAEIRLAWLDISAEWVTAVAENAEAFFEDYVLPRRPPPTLRSAGAAAPYPLDAAAEVRPATARELEIVSRLAELRASTREIEALREELAALCADTPAILGPDGRTVATYRPETRSVLDRSALPPAAVQAATTTTTARVLRVKGV